MFAHQSFAFAAVIFVGVLAAETGIAQESATGCLNRAGQLSRLQIGEEPLAGRCGRKQQQVRLLLEQQTSNTLTINEEGPVGTRVDLGTLGDFEFSVACTALDATRLLVRLDVTNTTTENLTVLRRSSSTGDIAAPGSLSNLWAVQVIPPHLDIIGAGGAQEGTFVILETSDVYDTDLAAAALDRSMCVFGGKVTLFPAAERETGGVAVRCLSDSLT
jgi:hypothetical protein